MSTAACPGHRYQSMTGSVTTPNYCETCKVWWGAPDMTYVTAVGVAAEACPRWCGTYDPLDMSSTMDGDRRYATDACRAAGRCTRIAPETAP